MNITWKTVRVFISSTFRDMQAERDYLVRFVFPRLREELLKERIYFIDVDLRWGVTSEQDALTVCREIIDECRPRFMCMLGDRYGWVPPGKSHSITAEEVHYGVLDRPLKDRGFAYFYFRDDAATAAMVETIPGEFREPQGSDNRNQLGQLKQEIIAAGLNPFTYSAQWDNDNRRLIGLKGFGNRVYQDLLESIKSDPELHDRFVTEIGAQLEEFEEENAAMETFIEERSERFVLGSRETVLNELLAHASAISGNGYVCLIGAPGSGKSALLAHLSQHPTLNSQPSRLLIRHFVGASPGSTDVRRTLRRLCHELKVGCPDIRDDIPDDAEKLYVAFPEFLRQACVHQRVVILLDAINQFDPISGFFEFYWLPEELPDNVRIILSALDSPALEELRLRSHRPREIELKPLTAEDGQAIVEQFRQRYRKQFEPEQRAALLSKTDAGVPLYLLAALEELRTLGIYEEITRRIVELPPTTDELFTWILERLENDDGFRDAAGRRLGHALVSRFAALLGASRHGLSERELADLLDTGDLQGNVAALLHLLHPYLMRRSELLDFYHSQFRAAVKDKYLHAADQCRAAHLALADYFHDQPLYTPDADLSIARHPNPRKLTELAYQLSEAGDHNRLIALFKTQEWMHARFEGGGYRHEDFLTDLHLAWQKHAHPRVAQSPEMVTTCFRLALIRTSINSVVSSVDANLVAPAVSTGLWPFERGMGFLETVQSPHQQSKACLALLKIGKLNPQQGQRIQRLLMATAQRLERGPNFRHELSTHDVLCQLAPYLEDELLMDAWHYVLREWPKHNGLYESKFIVAYAPRLKGEALVQALDLSLGLPDRTNGDLKVALGALAPHLSDLLPEALDRVLELDDDWDRAECLIALAPHLRAPLRERARTAALALPDDSLSFELDWDFHVPGKQSVLRALADSSQEPSQSESGGPKLSWLASFSAVEKALTISDRRDRVEHWIELIPNLAKKWRETAIQQALSDVEYVKDDWELSGAIVRLSPYLTSGAFVSGLSLALRIDYSSASDDALDALISQARRGLDPKTVAQCFELAQKCPREWTRTRLMAGLAPQFNADLLDMAITECSRLEGLWRAELIEALAPLVTGTRLHHLFTSALAIPPPRPYEDYGDYRDRAVAAVAPFLDRSMLSDYFDKTRRISDEEQQLRALTTALPNTDGELRARVLDHCLTLAHRLDKTGPTCANLAPYLQGQELPRFLHLVGNQASVADQAKFLAALGNNDQLNDPSIVAQALDAALGLPEQDEEDWGWTRKRTYPREEALIGLATRLGGQEFPQALACVYTLRDNRRRTSSWSELAPQCVGEFLARVAPVLEPQHFVLFCDSVAALQNPDIIASLFAAIAPRLTGPLLKRAIAAGLDAARALHDGDRQVRTLAALAEFIPEEPLRSDTHLQALTIASGKLKASARMREVLSPLTRDVRISVAQRLLEKQTEGGHLESIHRWRDVVAALAASLEIEDVQPIFAMALARLQAIPESQGTYYRNDRRDAITALLPHLHPRDRRLAIQPFLDIADSLSEYDRACLLQEWAPWTDAEQAKQMLGIANAIDDDQLRMWGLTNLGSQLDADECAAMVRSAALIEDDHSRAKALQVLVPQLPRAWVWDALKSVLQIRDGRLQLKAAWMILALRDEAEVTEALQALQELLAEQHLRENKLLAAIRESRDGDSSWFSCLGEAIADTESRALLLADMIPYLNDRLIAPAFELMLQLPLWGESRRMFSPRSSVLVALAPRLKLDLLERAMETALCMPVWDSEHCISAGLQVEALIALAPRLESELLATALERAVKLPDRNYSGDYNPRATVLQVLAPQLQQPGGREAYVRGLTAALSFEWEGDRSKAINDLLQIAPDFDELTALCCRAIAEYLVGCVDEKRERALDLCATSRLFSGSVFPSKFVSAITEHILEICNTWQWP